MSVCVCVGGVIQLALVLTWVCGDLGRCASYIMHTHQKKKKKKKKQLRVTAAQTIIGK